MDIGEGRGRFPPFIHSINICRESTEGQALSRVQGIELRARQTRSRLSRSVQAGGPGEEG